MEIKNKINGYDNIKVGIVVTSYNCKNHIIGLLKSLDYQTDQRFRIVIADDGSTDGTQEAVSSYKAYWPELIFLALEHGERGRARKMAIDTMIAMDPEYLLIIDGDMLLKRDLIEKACAVMDNNDEISALIIREIPYTTFCNYYSKVKVFERYIINNDNKVDYDHGIDAARFWRTEAYLESGGINEKQVAFEEIQPTLRSIEMGKKIEKLQESGIYHDEKKVTLWNILKKKGYYFSQMTTTIESENQGLKKTFSRFYLFRPVYYIPSNIREYIHHPLLFIGMIQMYILLTIVGTYIMGTNMIKKTLKPVTGGAIQ